MNYLDLQPEFLNKIEKTVKDKRDFSILHSVDSSIDLEHPQALLATTFGSFKEVEDDDTSKRPIYTFETKPKSAAVEYVPSKVLEYIDKNSE